MSKKKNPYIKINTTLPSNYKIYDTKLPTDQVASVARTYERQKKSEFERESDLLKKATAPKGKGETEEKARKRRERTSKELRKIGKRKGTWNPRPSIGGDPNKHTDFQDWRAAQEVQKNSGEIRDLDKIEAAKGMSDFNNYSMFGVNYANGQNPYINYTDDYNKAASAFEVTKGNMRNFIQAPALAYAGFTQGSRALLTSIAGAAAGKEGGEYIAKKAAQGLSKFLNLNVNSSDKLDALAEFAGGLGGTILGGSAGFAAGKITSRNPDIIFNKDFTGKSDIINPKGFENYFIPWYQRFVNKKFPNIAKKVNLDYDLNSAISDYARGKTISVGRLNQKSTPLTEVLNRIENENSLNSVNQTKQGLASVVSDNSPGWDKKSVMEQLDWGINRTRVVEPYNNATAKANDQFIDILTKDSQINPSYNTAGLYGNSTIRYRSNTTGNIIGHEAIHAAEDNVPEAESILAYKLFPEWPYASERGTSIHDIIFNNKEYPDIRSIGGMDYVLSQGNGYTQLFSNTVQKLPIERQKALRKELDDILKYFYPQ